MATHDSLEHCYQRRAIVGGRHYVNVSVDLPDVWAVPGNSVVSTDEDGIRKFGKACTVTTEQLKAYAESRFLSFRIDEHYPIVRRSAEDKLPLVSL